MKKLFYVFTLAFILYSCKSEGYYYCNSLNNKGLDFTKGKWLLAELDCPEDVNQELSESVWNNFYKYINTRLENSKYVKGILLPKREENPFTKTDLQKIKKITGHDYLINVKASWTNYKTQNLITKHTSYVATERQVYVLLEVYDLNTYDLAYSRRETGLRKFENNPSKDHFAKVRKDMIIKNFKYIMKNIRKTSMW